MLKMKLEIAGSRASASGGEPKLCRTVTSQTLTMITLKEGDKAPAFSGVDQDGNKISLKDYKGKKLVLYFYPEDDTPVFCLCNL